MTIARSNGRTSRRKSVIGFASLRGRWGSARVSYRTVTRASRTPPLRVRLASSALGISLRDPLQLVCRQRPALGRPGRSSALRDEPRPRLSIAASPSSRRRSSAGGGARSLPPARPRRPAPQTARCWPSRAGPRSETRRRRGRGSCGAAMFVFGVDTPFMNVSLSAPSITLTAPVSGVRRPIKAWSRPRSFSSAASSATCTAAGAPTRRPDLLRHRGARESSPGARGDHRDLGGPRGRGAFRYLPAMQSLIHGNFEGKATTRRCSPRSQRRGQRPGQRPVDRRFLTPTLSWRSGSSSRPRPSTRPARHPGHRRRAVHGRPVDRRVGELPVCRRHGRARRRCPRLAGRRRSRRRVFAIRAAAMAGIVLQDAPSKRAVSQH